MPELPEVETTVRGLKTKVLKRTFVNVWTDWEKGIKHPKTFGQFKREICGKKILGVWRRAKNVIFDLSEGCSLLIHQKMTGHLMVGVWNRRANAWVPAEKGPLEEKINLFLHLVLFLDNGQMIALSDYRKFANVELWKTEELLRSPEFVKLGTEPTDKNFSFSKFKEALRGKKGKVKQVLMNPEIIAGIGNIYANEALWWSKIHPKREISKLNEKELKSLYRSMRKVLSAGIRLGGESFADYRKVDGTKGDFDEERMVYKREKEKCFRCKTVIQRIKFGGRSSFFCPKCQAL